jgi:hypothetical protein
MVPFFGEATVKLTIPVSACAAMLAACAPSPNPIEKTLASDPFIGKDLWVPAVHLCEKPDLLDSSCTQMPGPDLHLKIDDEKMAQGQFYYHVTLEDGRTGYALSTLVLSFATEMDPAECKRRGEPRIGMTYKQVEATCWGKPKDINRTQTASGVTDQLVYGEGYYVYTRNGIVTGIQSGTAGRAPKAK